MLDLSSKHFGRHAASLAIIFSLAGCSDASRSSGSLHNVFGADDRIPITQEQKPYTSVGIFEMGCSGVLVGRSLVLTAAHCIVSPDQGQLQDPGPFRPMFQGELKSAQSRVVRAWYGSRTPELVRKKDWAILQLAEPLGDRQGWLPLEMAGVKDQLPLSTTLIGYDDKQNLSQVKDCQLLKVDAKDRILNDCDSTSGISGAPFVRQTSEKTSSTYSIVALAVSELRQGKPASMQLDQYSDEFANLAIADASLDALVKALRDTVDQGQVAPSLDGSIESGDFYGKEPAPRTDSHCLKEGNPSDCKHGVYNRRKIP